LPPTATPHATPSPAAAAAAAAAASAAATAAANAAANAGEKHLRMSADLCLEVLTEMKAPGIKLLQKIEASK
ncbi:MAG TPA: hypothetical protein DCQ33_04060, partial [Nitrospira sp.]|nr:hypothetical protein [Nitrospira sp.]